ncbi:PH domain-containing protein [uncultured Corynebacterium sp.]|uniref:PH domain-containing protein n=1 Tax=uncultured Corynebacterium sp. TaxID=159447 RepID=UPI0025CBF1E6|nr:PH domain-containing protein [uncultured Corynebacterium sp.]
MSTDRSALPTTRFRPQKTHFFGVAFLLFLAIMAMGFEPLWFAPLLLVPLIYSLWIMRVRTTVGARGITAVPFLGERRSLPWNRFRGVLFDKRGRAFAVGSSNELSEDTRDDVRFPLPAITFNSLPALNEASGGRIPDPITPALAAEEEKVEVFDRDGRSVKMTREEYEAETEAKARHANDVEAAPEAGDEGDVRPS